MQSNFTQVRNAPGLLLSIPIKKNNHSPNHGFPKTRGKMLVDNNVIQAIQPNLKPNPKI